MLRLLYGLIFGTSKISFPTEDVPTVYRLLSEARISTEPIKHQLLFPIVRQGCLCASESTRALR